MARKRLLAIMLASLAILPGLSSAAFHNLGYGTHTVDVDLAVNEDEAYIVPTRTGDRLKVDLTVVEGGSVDFYLTNLTAYMAYLESLDGGGPVDELVYVAEHSRQSTGEIGYTYTAFVTNTLVVVIDNTGWTVEGAQPSGPVSVRGTIVFEENLWTWQNIAITVLIICVAVAFMVGVKLPAGKKKE